MQVAAKQAAVALESVLNREAAEASQQELARERDHLRLLLEVSNAVAAKIDTRELFSAISVCLREALNVEYASLTLFDPDTNHLRRHSLDFPGGSGLLQEDAIIPIEGATAGEAFSKGTRLNVFPIVMPALRDRPEDIPPLVRYFAQQAARRMGKRITTIRSETMDGLVRYG